MPHLWEPWEYPENSWPGRPVNNCREEEINTSPPEAGGNQEVFDFTPSPLIQKEPESKLRQDGSSGARVYHLLGLLIC